MSKQSRKRTSAKNKHVMKIYTNEPTKMKAQFMDMLYKSIETGQLGYMDGLDHATGEVVPLLVGLDPVDGEEGKYQIYPLARLFLNTEELAEYGAPDGQGNYSGPTGVSADGEPGAADEEEGWPTV